MNSCEIKNIIDREELLQRLDLRIRTMSELMVTHEKYIISLSLSGNERDKAIRRLDKSQKDFIEAVAKIDNDTKEHFDKLRQEYNVSEETECPPQKFTKYLTMKTEN